MCDGTPFKLIIRHLKLQFHYFTFNKKKNLSLSVYLETYYCLPRLTMQSHSVPQLQLLLAVPLFILILIKNQAIEPFHYVSEKSEYLTT